MSRTTTGSTVHGFEIISRTDLPEYRSVGVLARHKKTGCEVYHLVNDDTENLFSFGFKTIPPDSTGVAHILEHTVLCGSRRFVVKDPFLSLLKGSMNTFLNALTFPDKTVYPAASTVEKDLFNIMKVYGDAVFFPLLKKELFQQEGHRLYFDESGKPTISGVVYNEMKGNYSSHDSIAAEWCLRSLFPDTPYGVDSGGDPDHIPSLTYEQFVAFHRSYYHPSNARVFLYGSIPTQKYLEFLETEFLNEFSKGEPVPEISVQPEFDAPRRVTEYAPSEHGVENAASITMNWRLAPVTDPVLVLSFEILTEVLLGNSGSPLHMALIDSGLGEDLSGPTGLETEIRDLVFSVGLRGLEPDKLDAVEKLILGELGRLTREGIEGDAIEAALRKYEFRNREIKGGGPFGLRLMRKAYRGWMHGAKPETTLEFERPFAELRKLARPGYFEQLIRSRLIENPHRTTVTIVPDAELAARKEAEIADRLAKIDRELTAAERERIGIENEALTLLQSTPDSPDDVAKIPFLTIDDAPRTVETILTTVSRLDGTDVHAHDVYTNGIVYVELAFDLEGLDSELDMLLPFFADILGELDLPGMSYDVLAREIDLTTGGIAAYLTSSPTVDDPDAVRKYLFIRVKALEHSASSALELLGRILRDSETDNPKRIRDILVEARNSMKASVIPAGSAYVALRSMRSLSRASAQDERWRGVSQYLYLIGLDPASGDRLAGSLDRLKREVFTRARLTVNITGTEPGRLAVERPVRALIASLPPGSGDSTAATGSEIFPRCEALIVPASVGYAASSIVAARIGTAEHAAESVLAHLLSTGFLWEQIRMKGGAYGAGAVARALEGAFSFYSYRDPVVENTPGVFRRAVIESAETAFTREAVELAVISIVGKDVRPLSPAEKGAIAFKRSLLGITDELRQKKRDDVLAMTPERVRAAAGRLAAEFDNAAVVVMAGREAVDRASVQVPALAADRLEIPV